MSAPLAVWGTYEVRLNRARTLVFVTNTETQTQKIFSVAAATAPGEIALGEFIPADVVDVIKANTNVITYLNGVPVTD